MKLEWFAGVDWGSQRHHVCVLDAAGKVLGERAFEHGGAGLSAMAAWLLSPTAGQAGDVGAALETPRGPVVESLMERGFVVHAINPKQLDRFRDRFSPAGAKDDRRDARVLASALRTDPHCLRRLESTKPTIVELREWSRLKDRFEHPPDRNKHYRRRCADTPAVWKGAPYEHTAAATFQRRRNLGVHDSRSASSSSISSICSSMSTAVSTVSVLP